MKREKLLRIADLMEEMASLFRELAEGSEGPVQSTLVKKFNDRDSGELVDDKGPDLFAFNVDPAFLRGEKLQGMTNGEPPIDNKQAEERVKELLKAKGFTLKKTKSKNVNPAIEHLAKFVGERYEHLRPLIQKIKRMQGTQKQIYLDLQEQPPQVISDVVGFLSQAKQAGLIPNFFYQKRLPAKRIICNPPVAPVAINFFTGEWLEIYALLILGQLWRGN